MLSLMRTTLNLPDDLLIEARKLAAVNNSTLSRVIGEALRESLIRRRAARPASPVHLTTCGGNGLQPGVNLDKSASLLDLMEGSGDPD